MCLNSASCLFGNLWILTSNAPAIWWSEANTATRMSIGMGLKRSSSMRRRIHWLDARAIPYMTSTHHLRRSARTFLTKPYNIHHGARIRPNLRLQLRLRLRLQLHRPPTCHPSYHPVSLQPDTQSSTTCHSYRSWFRPMFLKLDIQSTSSRKYRTHHLMLDQLESHPFSIHLTCL